MRTKNFVAVFERDPDDDAWLVSIQGIDGCQTYGRTLRQAEARIREALAAWLDRDPASLIITPLYSKEVSLIAHGVSAARQRAAQAGADAQDATQEAAKRLTALGLSRRDAAHLLGISHQRVQQLLAS